uniref:Uncharacterized protein n=1 Tax=Anguilla anguilla TaxID=7936 RepID=A0A0E9QGG9_ANGAN
MDRLQRDFCNKQFYCHFIVSQTVVT